MQVRKQELELDMEQQSGSLSSSNCCSLTCIQISQEVDKVVWWSDKTTSLFKTFPQFVVIHTVKGFGIVNKPYLTSMQSISCEMLGWMRQKLESRLPGEVSITSDLQMTPSLWQKVKKN